MLQDTLDIIGPLPLSVDSVVTDMPIHLSLQYIDFDTTQKVADTLATVVEPQWQDGLEGASIQKDQTANSGIITILVLLFVAISLNFSDCKKLITKFISEIVNNKQRENAFDDRTHHESRLTILTVIQFIVYGGIILAALGANRRQGTDIDGYDFGQLLSCIGLMGGYYIFQYSAYWLTGYTFGGREAGVKWLRALNASQSLAGFALILPGLFILSYPTSTTAMIDISCLVYVVARFLFIYKGFCIFYRNIFSSVYFILYLCALEIIPLIWVYKLDTFID